jgi:hypothetical protein
MTVRPLLPQPQVVGRAHQAHINVRIGAGWRRHQLGHHQLLVRQQGRPWLAGDGEEAAAIPLIFVSLLLLELRSRCS